MLDNLRPPYAKQFRCMGSACEDACCSGWDVNIDRTTYQKYESLPAMRPRLKEWFTVFSEDEEYYAPLMARYPYLMENCLVNHIYRDRFPFSKGGKLLSNPLNEYVFMCLEYSAIKGLLIGTSAHYRGEFSLRT